MSEKWTPYVVYGARTRTFPLKCSDEELDELKSAAANEKTSVADLIRDAIRRRLMKTKKRGE